LSPWQGAPRKPHVSPSALDMYLRCGEQYRRAYIEKEKIPPGVALVKGGSVHKAAEVNFAQKIESHVDLPVGDLLEAAASHVDQTLEREGMMLTPDEEGRGLAKVKGELVDRATALTKTFHKHIAPTVQPVLVERFVRIDLPRHSHDLLGRLDCVDDGDRVRDLKTSSRRKSEDEVQRSDQLTFYHAAMKKETGREPKEVVLDVLVDTKTPAVQTLRSNRTQNDKQVFLNRLNSMIQGVNAGVFPPAPLGHWCCSPKFCGYWFTCPYVNSERTAAAAEAQEAFVP